MPLLPAVPLPFLPHRHGEPSRRSGGWTFYPETRDWRLRWQGRRFGLACRWRAPRAVTAVAPDGEVHHVRVRDATRRWQVAVLVVAGVAVAILRRRSRAASSEDLQQPGKTTETDKTLETPS